MPSTYSQIASQTVSGTSTNTITFNTLPSTYTDLICVVNGGVTAGTVNLYIRFNNDAGSNYSFTALSGTGSAASSTRASNTTQIFGNDYGYMSADMNTNYIFSIMNYNNSTTYKTLISRSNNAGNGVSSVVGLWRSTSNINRLDLIAGANNFASGTTFSLYGIKAA